MCCLNVIFLVIYSLSSSNLFFIMFLNLSKHSKELIQINELIRAHDEIKNPSSTEVKRVAGKEPTHV